MLQLRDKAKAYQALNERLMRHPPSHDAVVPVGKPQRAGPQLQAAHSTQRATQHHIYCATEPHGAAQCALYWSRDYAGC